jgi:hypothetical protein
VNKTWNTSVVGVLASDESSQHAFGKKAVFQNAQNELQLYVRIISRVPDSFPPIRLVNFYGSDLEEWGFEGNELEGMEARRAVYQFLADNLIVFKPQRKIGKDGLVYYAGKDLTLLPKSERYHEGVHFTPLPIFSEEEQGISQLDFEERLQTQQFVGVMDTISSEQKDTPKYVLWKKSDSDYRVYGEFSGHRYGEEGFVFTTNKQMKSAPFKDEWLDVCYEYKNTMFLPYEIYRDIAETIKEADAFVFPYTKSPIMQETQRQLAVTSNPTEEYYSQSSRNRPLEDQLMNEFINTTRVQGLLYDEKDLYNFHTAMKSSNLVILAGMSGTGKSKLVKAYGQALGLNEDYQITFIPVRPSWTDDADVIGYADTLNHVYRPGDSGVINALLSANQSTSKLHIICFDEMNLARVEHYFSQFLSVMEMESGPSKILRLYNDNLRAELTNSNLFPPVIPIGDNVIFVGTVNLDESTYHFSDKVLDRANVITLKVLPFPSLITLTVEGHYPVEQVEGSISFEMFESFRKKNRDIHMKEKELALLWDIHTELQKVNKNMGVGPRIVRQMDLYLKNLPESNNYTREEAFDKQIVQRILTKVRGPEDQLNRFIGKYDKGTENLEESILVDILDRYHEVSEFYETRNVVIHKAKELKLNGYTL